MHQILSFKYSMKVLYFQVVNATYYPKLKQHRRRFYLKISDEWHLFSLFFWVNIQF